MQPHVTPHLSRHENDSEREETKDGPLKGKGEAQVSNPCQLSQLTGCNCTLPRSVSATQGPEHVKMAWTHHPTPSVPPISATSTARRHEHKVVNGRRKPQKSSPNTKTMAIEIPANAGSPLHLELRPFPRRRQGMWADTKG